MQTEPLLTPSTALAQRIDYRLTDDPLTLKKIDLNFKRNREQDNTQAMDSLSSEFDLGTCRNEWWNPEQFSLLWGTKLWNQCTESQRKLLNQIYWVAYYSQIISAEIATIFFNQTSAAALYGIEDFRVVCDTLDLESAQERAHINAFKKISEKFEFDIFGERVFSYPMRGPYSETMIFRQKTAASSYWRSLQLKAFAMLSSNSAFLGCQYFAVRGLRTLNGKIVQHKLSQYYSKMDKLEKPAAPIPSKISYHHFLDESFHFNSSLIISVDILKILPKPTRFEAFVANKGIAGSQVDHYNFSSAINGLFWYDPALYEKVYKILRAPVFGLSHHEAREMMTEGFTQENEGVHASYHSRNVALESYKDYVSKLDYVTPINRDMKIISRNSLQKHLRQNKQKLALFFDKMESRAGHA